MPKQKAAKKWISDASVQARIDKDITTPGQASQVLHALEVGYDLLGDEKDWCQGQEIIPKRFSSNGHVQRCAIGAIHSRTGNGVRRPNRERAINVLDTVGRQTHNRSIVGVNDSGKAHESFMNVRAAYRRAISLTKQRISRFEKVSA